MTFSGPPLGDEGAHVLLPEFVLAETGRHEDRAALIDGLSGRTVSYRQLATSVNAFAAGLAQRGYGPGHTLALACVNQPEFATVLYGALAAGLRVALIDPHIPGVEFTRQVKAVQADLLVMVPGFGRLSALTHGGAMRELRIIGETESTIGLAELMNEASPAPELNSVAAVSPAVVLFTPGMQDTPKGVVLSHRNLVANSQQMQARLPLGAGDAIVAADEPWCRAFGLSAVLDAGLRAGATLITVPDLDLPTYLKLSSRYAATRAYVRPAVVSALVHVPNLSVGALRTLNEIVCLGGPLPGDLQQECEDRVGSPVLQTWGMTELSPMALAEAPRGHSWPGRVGKPLAGTQCRLLNPLGEDAVAGETGELWVRGPQVMLGYLDDQASTEARIDEQGWLRTGALALTAPDGAFRIVGQLDERLRRSERSNTGSATSAGSLRRRIANLRRTGRTRS